MYPDLKNFPGIQGQAQKQAQDDRPVRHLPKAARHPSLKAFRAVTWGLRDVRLGDGHFVSLALTVPPSSFHRPKLMANSRVTVPKGLRSSCHRKEGLSLKPHQKGQVSL